MFGIKKISPIEFRLSQRSFKVDYSPNNYFEKFQIEIILQNLANWFYWKYGLFLFIQRVRLREHKILLQLYYYPTHLQERFVTKFEESLENTSNSQLVVSQKEIILDQNLWTLINDSIIEQGDIIAESTEDLLNEVLDISDERFDYAVESEMETLLTPKAIDFYFTYYFQHNYKLESNILYKNLAKQFFSNDTLKREHKHLLFSTKYLQKATWSYDLYFFSHFAIVYSDPGFLINIFYKGVAQSERQKKFFYNFADILKKFAVLKRGTIRGIKLILNGVYDRHGRTRIWVWQVGKISVMSERSLISYDWITFETRYGSFSLKIWIAYNEVNATPYLLELDR